MKVRHILLTVLVLAAGVRIWLFVQDNVYYDDAYITLRYAESFVHHAGYAFNPGEQVFGASSPLFMFMLALLLAVFNTTFVAGAMQWIGTLCLLATVLIIFFRYSFTPVVKLLLIIALLAYPRIFYASTGGMEECFIVLLMAWSAIEARNFRLLWMGVAIGLLFVTKVDTLVWSGLLFMAVWIERRSFPWRTMVAALLVALPWMIYCFLTFHTLIPHTVEAKMLSYPAEGPFSLQELFLLFTPEVYRQSLPVVYIFGLTTTAIILLATGLMVRTRDWLMLPFPVYCVAYIAALTLSGTSIALWERWTVPLWVCVMISGAYIVEFAAGERLSSFVERFGQRALALLVVLAALALILPASYSRRKVMSLHTYELVGDWLKEHASRESTVMLEPIGVIGYRSGLYVHDFIGLVSPDVTEARKRSGRSDRWYMQYVQQHLPSYLLLRPGELAENKFRFGGYGGQIFTEDERQWFNGHYVRVQEWDDANPVFSLVLFQRR